MTIVIQDVSWEYLYKKNHSYTDTTNVLTRKDECNLYGKGERRGRSQERIYKDDQMVILVG